MIRESLCSQNLLRASIRESLCSQNFLIWLIPESFSSLFAKASSSKVDRTSNGTIDVTYSKLPMTVMFMIVML